MQMYPNYLMNNNQQYPQQGYVNGYPQMQQGINPYMDQLSQLRSMQNTVPQQQVMMQGLMARMVDDFNIITANDVPMDGNGAVFIKRDGSEIQVRNWTANGTIATTSYIPVLEPKGEQTGILPNQNRELKFDEVLGLIGAVSEKVDGLSARLDDFIKTKASSRTKKEVDE